MVTGIFDKRDDIDWHGVGGSKVMFKWHDVRHEHLAMVHNVTMNMTSADTAMFKTDQWEVLGDVLKIDQVRFLPSSS